MATDQFSRRQQVIWIRDKKLTRKNTALFRRSRNQSYITDSTATATSNWDEETEDFQRLRISGLKQRWNVSTIPCPRLSWNHLQWNNRSIDLLSLPTAWCWICREIHFCWRSQCRKTPKRSLQSSMSLFNPVYSGISCRKRKPLWRADSTTKFMNIYAAPPA